MVGTLYFVHGTGVRKSGYERTWAAVQDGARRNGVPASVFVGCPWGQALGVPTDRIADTLPREVATRDALGAGPPPTENELRAATWALLLDDPLFALRLAGAAARLGDGGSWWARREPTRPRWPWSGRCRPGDRDWPGLA